MLRSTVKLNLRETVEKGKIVLILLSPLRLTELQPQSAVSAKMEKALNVYVRYFERDRVHVTFITAYCYNRSLLLL